MAEKKLPWLAPIMNSFQVQRILIISLNLHSFNFYFINISPGLWQQYQLSIDRQHFSRSPAARVHFLIYVEVKSKKRNCYYYFHYHRLHLQCTVISRADWFNNVFTYIVSRLINIVKKLTIEWFFGQQIVIWIICQLQERFKNISILNNIFPILNSKDKR